MARQGLTQSPALPPWAGEGLAGVAAGVATAVVSHPMDTIKTRLQARGARLARQWLCDLTLLAVLCADGSGWHRRDLDVSGAHPAARGWRQSFVSRPRGARVGAGANLRCRRSRV